jgi:4-aminobutyrate aminotransferase/(S)-3-amino-2-methylpropionate transaminase
VETLARTECPSFTTRRARRAERAGAPHDPIVWAEARGVNVVDVDGNRYVDMTAGFGVAAIGHAHPRVVAAIEKQSHKLLHALGDLHPSDVKVALLERLAALAPWDEARVVLALGGADAVEAAIKTAMLATKKPGIVAFEPGYHGLSHGPLAVSGFSEAFRTPFAAQLNPHVTFVPYPDAKTPVDDAVAAVERAWPGEGAGAIFVEPMLGRGGIVVPPRGFLRKLEALAHARKALLVVDEIFTGFGRTGARFRSVADGATPDLICVGKALGGGLPTSALLGRAEVMSAWGDPEGAAIHTGTFFGHPLGCAAAHASLDVIEGEDLARRSREVGGRFGARLGALGEDRSIVREVRGLGLATGVVLDHGDRCLRVVRRLLERGYLALPAGPDASVLQIVPPLIIDEALLGAFVDVLAEILVDEVRS